eukprot:2571008-Pyramimonas_sp.AAC.1
MKLCVGFRTHRELVPSSRCGARGKTVAKERRTPRGFSILRRRVIARGLLYYSPQHLTCHIRWLVASAASDLGK